MKKIAIIVATATLMMSCSLLKGGSASTPATTPATTTVSATAPTSAVSAGQNAGAALLALYNQYKADGKYNYTNANNILNSVALVAACADLKNYAQDKEYRSSFGQGMLLAATGLVTKNNVNTITDQLVNMVTTSEKVNTATTTVQEQVTTAATNAQEKVTEAVTSAQNTVSTAAASAQEKLATAASAAASISSILSLFTK